MVFFCIEKNFETIKYGEQILSRFKKKRTKENKERKLKRKRKTGTMKEKGVTKKSPNLIRTHDDEFRVPWS